MGGDIIMYRCCWDRGVIQRIGAHEETRWKGALGEEVGEQLGEVFYFGLDGREGPDHGTRPLLHLDD